MLLSLSSLSQIASGGALIPKPESKLELTMEVDFKVPKGFDLPESVDLTPWFPPAGNQHRQYSCTAWALAYGVMSYRFNLAVDRIYGADDTLNPSEAFSPAYLFNLMKKFRDKDCLTGLDFQEVAQFIRFSGCCSLEAMPYDTAVNACTNLFDNSTFPSAIRRHAPPMIYLDGFNPEQWQYHLARGTPIVALISPNCDIMSNGYDWDEDAPYIWQWDTLVHERCPGHAVVCTGYANDSTFTFRNSYGKEWGWDGDFQITHFTLGQRCSGGYIMPNDTNPVWPKPRPEPADKDTLAGPRVCERIKEGTFQVINDKRYVVDDLDHNTNYAVIHVYDIDTDSLVQSLVVENERPYVFYEEGQSITVVVRPKRRLLRVMPVGASIRVGTIREADDPYLARRNKRLVELNKGITQ